MHDFEHDGYKIRDSNGGFQPGSGNFKIGAYIAVKEDTAYGFAFFVSSLALAQHGKNPFDEELFQQAREIIMSRLDRVDLENREEYTFEYDPDIDVFVEVANPRWWIKATHHE